MINELDAAMSGFLDAAASVGSKRMAPANGKTGRSSDAALDQPTGRRQGIRDREPRIEGNHCAHT